MLILEKIWNITQKCSDEGAIYSDGKVLTYKELWEKSDRLASYLIKCYDDKNPIIVYGHKDPLMLVCFLACVKSGHAYCPVDVSMPMTRIKDILREIGNPIVLSTEPLDYTTISSFNRETTSLIEEEYISNIIDTGVAIPDLNKYWIDENDTFYIIFTSGSTGNPKGVEITHGNLTSFTNWSEKFFSGSGNIMNQAPFSFDLSVMDTYTSLVTGNRLCCLTKTLQSNTCDTLNFIKEQNINYTVSTPSFINMVMADKTFESANYPEIRQFLFCGERLTKDTAARIFERFPNCKIINTYGPTEATVAVTEVEITKDMIDADLELPIGVAKEGTEIEIRDEEILIKGDTVSKGYYKDPEKTDKAFSVDCKGLRTYRTGDKGFFENGMLYYMGRMDNQIKLHGYRIELEDIEANLTQIEGICEAVVLPKEKDGQIRSLTAFVTAGKIENQFEMSRQIKNKLSERLPSYMIPKKINFMDSMPMNSNGKADRKRLKELL